MTKNVTTTTHTGNEPPARVITPDEPSEAASGAHTTGWVPRRARVTRHVGRIPHALDQIAAWWLARPGALLLLAVAVALVGAVVSR
jgi:hypothetical protein